MRGGTRAACPLVLKDDEKWWLWQPERIESQHALHFFVGYAVEHGLMSRNVAQGLAKLPAAEGEGGVVDQNVLTPAELRKLIAAAVDPWGMPIMLAAFTGARQAEVLGDALAHLMAQSGNKMETSGSETASVA
jgi:hypothetical protein